MEYRFLNQADRNKSVMGENGYEFQKAKGKFPKQPKQPKIKKGKHSITRPDADGFYPPKRVYPCKQTGILCAIFGDTPENRRSDIYQRMDALAKKVYEHEIDELMCANRWRELQVMKHFANEDIRASFGEKDSSASESASEKEKKRREILDSVTWRFDWIQLNKKDCYLFAEYTAENLLGKNDPVKYLKSLPQNVRLQVLRLGKYYDEGQQKCILPDDDSGVSKGVVKKAETYWWMLNRRYDHEKFRTEFIRRACEMPEANRRFIDVMYEIAWDMVLTVQYGMNPDKIPAPWYDSLPLTDDEESADDVINNRNVTDEDVNYKKNSNDDKEIRQDEI